MKNFYKLVIIGCLVPSLTSANVLSDIVSLYNRIISKGLANYRSTTIAHSEFEPSPAPGKIVSNVNIFNGQPHYNIPLTSINARGLFWGLNLNYYGGVQPTLQASNETAPSGLYGLGWNMSTPYVAVNHHGTVTTTDDFFYCNLGPYGAGQILQNQDGDYFVSTNPYIKVLPTIAAKKFVKWKFIMPDGMTFYFGESENSRRKQLYLGNVIAAYPANIESTSDFTYRYDLSRVTDFNEATSILFEYSKVEEPVLLGKTYTRESALSSIYWKDGNVTIDSISLEYLPMEEGEYPGYGVMESKDSQRLFETRYLSKIKKFVQGQLYKVFVLSQEIMQMSSYSPKRFLKSVKDSVYVGEAKSWILEYDSDNGLLNMVRLPNNSVDHFSYSNFPLEGHSDAESSVLPDTMRDETGSPMQIPVTLRSKYLNWTSCNEEFCYASLTKKVVEGYNDLFVQVYHNDGNYFSNPFSFQMKGGKRPTLFPSSNFFVLAELDGKSIDFFEWDGFKFTSIDSTIGDFFSDTTNLSGVIENVIIQENFILVVERDNEKRRVYPIARNSSTGKWTFLNRHKDWCGFANISDYGDIIRDAESDACLEWTGSITVDASPTMFIVWHKGSNVLNAFAYGEGNFKELTKDPLVFQYYGVQKVVSNTLSQITGGKYYSMNFQDHLAGMALAGNTLFFALNKDDNRLHTVGMYFDGKKFYEMANATWDDQNGANAEKFVINDNFVVEISYTKSKVFLWRKKNRNGRLIFELDRAEVFDFDGTDNNVFCSVSKDALYLEEKYSSTRPVIRGGRYHNRLLYIPRNPSSPVQDYTGELDSNVFDLQFSQSDPIVFFQTGLSEEEKLCAPNELCYVRSNSRMRNFSEKSFFRSSPFYEIPLNFHFYSLSSQSSYSTPNRLMARTVIDTISNSNLIALVQFSGQNFTNPQAYPVVSRFWRGSSNDSTNNYTDFSYAGAGDASIMEFNSNTLQAQFVSPVVSSVTFANNDTMSKIAYDFIADLKDMPLIGYQKNLQGTLRLTRTYDRSGALRSSTADFFALDSGKGRRWPDGLVVNLNDSTSNVSVDYTGNRVLSSNKKVYLDNESGQFRGSFEQVEPYCLFAQKILDNQVLANNQDNMTFRNPIAQYTYAPFSQNPLSLIENSDPTQIFLADSVASASKMSYSSKFPGMVVSRYRWQAPVRNGSGYPLSSGWLLADTVISTDDYGHVTEKAAMTNVGLRSSCNIYEGHRVLLTGTFSNAACTDVAINTAEHGSTNGWEMAQTVLDSGDTYTSQHGQVHSGLYSFRVTDGYGPTKNISIKELHRYRYSYIISGFAYSMGAKPMLMAEFRRADKSVARTIGSYEPVGEKFRPHQWQRYEIEIPYTELIANGMFADTSADDHLRIWLGTGNPRGDSTRVIYVDDVVAYPSSSKFFVTTYDRAGHPLTTMDMYYQKMENVYDLNHKKRAVRDSKGRIFMDNATHKLGENMGVNND